MNGNKVSLIDQHAADQRVASAVLGAPAFLSGLTEAEMAIVHQRVEQHVSPEFANARDAMRKALTEAEQGWQRAQDVIGQRADLTRGADGSWSHPADAGAAA